MADMAWRSLRAASKLIVARRLDLRVEGSEFLPASGPAIVAARHFHHLYDGCVLLAQVSRPLHLLVALDWVHNRPGRMLMERACRAASWPVVLRRDGVNPVGNGQAARAFRQAVRESLALLESGRILLVFPEGYPNVDPGYTPKRDDAEFLPFQPGLVRLATLAAARGLSVPIVPAGFSYQRGDRWQVILRFGAPITVERRTEEEAVLREIEMRVRCLSAHPFDRPNLVGAHSTPRQGNRQ
jgi:putative membrane protein